ncbi:hypothetical protein KEM56_002260 [Ascosphaera pollenicola]|nr:hypothetical protein KEM56_002260 [Ascosphaera pollenicola]
MDSDRGQDAQPPLRESIFSSFSYQNVPADEESDLRSPTQWSASSHDGINSMYDPGRHRTDSDQRPANIDGDGEDVTHQIPSRKRSSQTTVINDSYAQDSITELSSKNHIAGYDRASVVTVPYTRDFTCTTRHQITRGKGISITVLIIGITSFVGSFLYLYAAIKKPDWSERINTDGGLNPTTASLLCTLIAKIIEMAFVTLVVASIGQYLSHRAIQYERGVSTPELFMRNWILQPGSIFTQFPDLKVAGFTVLGVFTFFATLGAMFYTTAAEALVSPKITMGHNRFWNVSVTAHAKFADVQHIQANCYIPGHDYFEKGSDCMSLANVGQSYHNYQGWLSEWNGSLPQPPDLKARPPPSGYFMENTTVRGSWLDAPKKWRQHDTGDRLFNRATVAFPHVAVFDAAVDPANKIRQPTFFENSSTFDLEAAVASPILDVLCAGVSEDELSPLVYHTWPNQKFNASEFAHSTYAEVANEVYGSDNARNLTNSTVIDSIYGWGDSSHDELRPVFGTFPMPDQTLINIFHYGLVGAYVLVGVPEELTQGMGSPYLLCKMKAGLGGQCSTTYHAESSGGRLFTNCEEDNYMKFKGPSLDDGNAVYWDQDWANIASTWLEAVSLSTGLLGDPAANPGILSHFVPDSKDHPLPADRPSVAEALAVMAGSTLLESTKDATVFIDAPEFPCKQKAYMRLQGTIMQSGGQTQGWQKVLFASLFVVCLVSLVCCGFLLFELFVRHITDFTEPKNLFTLAMNSPPTERLEGSCGGGPSKSQLKQGWKIDLEQESQHYYIRPWDEKKIISSQAGLGGSTPSLMRPAVNEEFEKLQTRSSAFISRTSLAQNP